MDNAYYISGSFVEVVMTYDGRRSWDDFGITVWKGRMELSGQLSEYGEILENADMLSASVSNDPSLKPYLIVTASRHYGPDTIEALIRSWNIDFSEIGVNGFTLEFATLMNAALNAQHELDNLNVLIKSGLNVNCKGTPNGETILMKAAHMNFGAALIRKLISIGCDPDVENNDGVIALGLMIDEDIKASEVLINKKTNFDAKGLYGDSILEHLMNMGHFGTIEMCLKKGANDQIISEKGGFYIKKYLNSNADEGATLSKVINLLKIGAKVDEETYQCYRQGFKSIVESMGGKSALMKLEMGAGSFQTFNTLLNELISQQKKGIRR